MILEKQQIKIENLMSLRRNMTQQEIPKEMSKIEEFLKDSNAEKTGPIISTTYSIVQAINPTMDMEILIPVDEELKDSSDYKFKKELFITNAIKIIHKGNPNKLQDTFNELNSCITQNKLQPVTPAYNVTIRAAKDISEVDAFEMHIYVGINPNKL